MPLQGRCLKGSKQRLQAWSCPNGIVTCHRLANPVLKHVETLPPLFQNLKGTFLMAYGSLTRGASAVALLGLIPTRSHGMMTGIWNVVTWYTVAVGVFFGCSADYLLVYLLDFPSESFRDIVRTGKINGLCFAPHTPIKDMYIYIKILWLSSWGTRYPKESQGLYLLRFTDSTFHGWILGGNFPLLFPSKQVPVGR